MSSAGDAQKALDAVVRCAHIQPMTLAEWMAANGISDEVLATELGIDRSTVSRVRRGRLMPSSSLIAAFAKASKGSVEPNTFFRPPYPVSAETGVAAD